MVRSQGRSGGGAFVFIFRLTAATIEIASGSLSLTGPHLSPPSPAFPSDQVKFWVPLLTLASCSDVGGPGCQQLIVIVIPAT